MSTPAAKNSNPEVRQLQPQALWNYFADLNAVPRPSKQEARVIEFIRQFGQSLGLKTEVDDVGNVLIAKPATAGMENRATVVLQSHLDMVHQKNADTDFDFATQGIQMQVDGDWVRAAGTTLGADNGIGVAAIMALLASTEIAHPPIEALFTIDEETGMTGAKSLQPNWLSGTIMLNLDTEEDDELTIGCAGGVDVLARCTYSPQPADPEAVGYRVAVKGLKGGHSGMDIHRGRANANRIMNRLIDIGGYQFQARLARLDGGGLRNAIPRESNAILTVPQSSGPRFEESIRSAIESIKAEYRVTDPDLEIQLETVALPTEVVPADFQKTLVAALFGVVNGIVRLSPSIPDLVQTSNNLARVLVADGQVQVDCLTRSSVDSERHATARSIAAVLETTGATVSVTGDYPGWEPDPDSAIVALMTDLYQEMFHEAPHVSACHAGLECGLVGNHYPGMEMISFGPTIRGAHSPDEMACISSVQKFWPFLLKTLQKIPVASSQA